MKIQSLMRHEVLAILLTFCALMTIIFFGPIWGVIALISTIGVLILVSIIIPTPTNPPRVR